MKILHINTQDKGGAGKACIRLHQALLKQGVDSNLLLLNKYNNNIQRSYKFVPQLYPVSSSVRVKNKIQRILSELYLYKPKRSNSRDDILKGRSDEFELFSFPDTPYNISTHPLYIESDIINLHWTTGFVDYLSFFSDSNKKIVWTLHDMNPFTGGCHYAGDCLGYENQCMKCPQLFNTEDENYSNIIFSKKKQALSGKVNLTVVPISNWLLTKSKSSALFKQFNHVQIPNGLDENSFKPFPKDFARDLLGIPNEKKVILFVSDSLTKKRKGFDYLIRAIKNTNNFKDVLLCAVGFADTEVFNRENLFQLGFISDERLMRVVYSAADVFVIPSIEDNFPNTVLESIMCGTPVVGFPIGGVKEMIVNKLNGYLCEDVGVDYLVKSLNMFLAGEHVFNSIEIRADAIRRYGHKVQAQKYIELYDSVLRNR